MLIDEDGGAKSWLHNTMLSCHQALHLMRRVSARGWGIKEVGLRQMALALITSKILYAYPYMRLNATQRLQLERINRKAMRLVTGLPQYCPVVNLHACSNINALQDLAEQQLQAQRVRLSTTAAGRQILQALGYNVDNLEPLSSAAPPWELIDLVDGIPLPKNMSSANPQRRKAAAKRHRKMSHKLAQEGAIQLYTDAAQFQHCAAIACHDSVSDTSVVQRLSEEHTVTNLELIAIRLAITRIVARQDRAPCTYHVYTDSQAAYTACRAGGADYAILNTIRTQARRLREEGYTLIIKWIPAHEGITGNEKAHQAARAAALSAPLPGSTFVSASWPPEDVTHPSSPHMDRAETWHRAQRYRRSILQHLANPEQLYRRPDSSFRRVEAVLLRRAQTGQLLSPAKLHLINPQVYPSPQCPTCPARGTAEHLLWSCPTFDAVRERALKSLGGLRPATLQAWSIPHRTSGYQTQPGSGELFFLTSRKKKDQAITSRSRPRDDPTSRKKWTPVPHIYPNLHPHP